MKLAELKRHLKTNGKTLTMVNFEWLDTKSKPTALLNIERKIAEINTVGFCLWTDKGGGLMRRSYMTWPKAEGFKFTPASGGSVRDSFTFTDEFSTVTYLIN